MNKPFCRTCGHFHANREDGAGVCRAHPPVALGHRGVAFWPSVQSNDWCGEYEPAEQATETGQHRAT